MNKKNGNAMGIEIFCYWFWDLWSKCGRYPGFQVTGMMEWGQKSKPKNILDQHLTPQKSHAKFLSNKNFQKALNDVTITNLHIVLITPKNPYLNEGSQKNTCQNFPTQILKSKISNPKNPLIIPVTWNPVYPPPPGSIRDYRIKISRELDGNLKKY